MRVLVTRPRHSGERTARRLRELGHEPILLPLAQPVHDADTALHALKTTEGSIAITSAEAIRALAEKSAELADHLVRPVFAVGEATAEEARAIGFVSVTASGGNGHELAGTIAEKASAPVLYLTGLPRAEAFEKRAREIGLQINVVECYRMQPIRIEPQTLHAIFAHQRPDAVLLYSRQTAESYFRMIEEEVGLGNLLGTRFLCLSSSVAEAVPEPLRGAVSTAPAPEERSLLSLL
ncbi:uroporphyrinogen-III synthase [Rhizobium cauense]|uniref:uroporphyrinogen-III synthase n=1 Tax=Rhizobium cauense TaxID=1166683 RepID=UPI001C6E738F|nr:uroporphyrinogen-III synthase [Rhizobium cauense]MBW9114396.1 uroporphyrinogen-III synthase [Rhizobium cauense]